MRIWTPMLALLVAVSASACSPEQTPIEEPAEQAAAAPDTATERLSKAEREELRQKTIELMQPPQLEWEQPKSTLSGPELERQQPLNFIQTQSRYEQQFDKDDALDLVLVNRAKHTAYKKLRVSLSYLGESGNVLRRDTVRVTGHLLVERALRVRVPITNPPAEWIPFSHDYHTEVVTAVPVK